MTILRGSGTPWKGFSVPSPEGCLPSPPFCRPLGALSLKDVCSEAFLYRLAVHPLSFKSSNFIVGFSSVKSLRTHWQPCDSQEPSQWDPEHSCLPQRAQEGPPDLGVAVVGVQSGKGSVHLDSLLVRLDDGRLPPVTAVLGGRVSAGGGEGRCLSW